MEKTSQKNSLKLTETLGELEAALQAWDKAEHEPTIENTNIQEQPLSENDPRRKAQVLLRQLREQIAQLSEN